MTKANGVAAKTLEIKEQEIAHAARLLLAAYLIAFVTVGLIVYTRGIMFEWIE